jgi:malate synthase
VPDVGRNQPPRDLSEIPPHPQVSRELISAIVERIDTVRNRLLDDAPFLSERASLSWEDFRIELDRELRDIALTLASTCPPA